MSKQTDSTDPSPNPVGAGRNGRLIRSTLWSWAGQLVFIASGFILPRSIDHIVGQEMLGIWDFSWSIVGFFHLIEFGVSSSVNRYVARHLANDDIAALNRTMSSVFSIQLMIGLAILLVTVSVTLAVPLVWSARLGDLVSDAQWVIFFLGLSMAVGFGFGGFAGVITGCHRWGIYNMIGSAAQIVSLAGMLLSLFLTGSIKLLGMTNALGGLVAVIGFAIAAHRICPGLKIRFSYADRGTMAEMLGFGGKTFMNGLSRSLLYQGSAMMMATYLGPAVLAVYSRPLALVGVVRTFTTKFAHTLTPISGEMQVNSAFQAKRDFAGQMARVGAILVLPPVVFLSVLGGPLLLLWMGPDYQNDLLPMILALGHLWAFANLPLQSILTGINAHGRIATAAVISSAVCAAVCWLAVAWFGGGIYTIALCIGITLTLSDGAYVTAYTCRKLEMSMGAFLLKVWTRPILCMIPVVSWLLISRILFSPIQSLIFGGVGGCLVLATVYWRWMLPTPLRGSALRWIGVHFKQVVKRIGSLRSNAPSGVR